MQDAIQKSCKEDEIDLRELWKTIIAKKIWIMMFISVFTSVATIYTYLKTPIYEGSALVEIGRVVSSNTNSPMTVFYLDDPKSLQNIVQQNGVDGSVIVNTPNLLSLSFQSTNKASIKTKLNEEVNFILERHRQQMKLYESSSSKISNTTLIGEISVKDSPINPKKILIILIGAISGLIVGIFVVLLSEAFRNDCK